MIKLEVRSSIEKHNKYLTEVISKETTKPSLAMLNSALEINNEIIKAIDFSGDKSIDVSSIRKVEEIYNNTKWLKKYIRIKVLAAKAIRELKCLQPTKIYKFVDMLNDISGKIEGEDRRQAKHEARYYIEKEYGVKCDMAKLKIIGE